MFEVNENGDLVYNGETSEYDENLFSVPEETSPPSDGELLDEGQDLEEDNIINITPDSLEVAGDLTLSTSGDIYIYPDLPDAEPLMEDRSVYTANVQGLPNSTTLSYLEDVVAGYPSWYEYLCFKTDANYAQSMCLWIGPKAEKNSGQNRIDFSDGVDCIQVNYIRNGSTSNYYYQYSKVHYDSYQIPYNSDVFLYTNVVDGYGRFDLKQSFSVPGYLFLAAAAVILFMIFRGGGKS